MEKISPPVQAIEDYDLDQVSGGAINPMDAMNIANSSYNQFSQLTSTVLDPLVGIAKDEIEFNKKYGPTIEVLASYDRSNDKNKFSIFAQSWNKKHPGQGHMSAELAEQVLGVSDSTTRAMIALLPNTYAMEQALATMSNTGS